MDQGIRFVHLLSSTSFVSSTSLGFGSGPPVSGCGSLGILVSWALVFGWLGGSFEEEMDASGRFFGWKREGGAL